MGKLSYSMICSLPGRLAFALSLVGAAVSAYLSYEHFTGSATLACSDNGAINCLKVTTSRWSEVAGVPVAVAGLAYFLAMALLCAPTPLVRDISLLRLIGAVVGAAAVLWLVFVEIFQVGAICLWCTGVHAITLALLGSVLWWRRRERA